jgi:CBS domain-containing protein
MNFEVTCKSWWEERQMKVKEVMKGNPKACSPTDSLADAAHFMWDYDCGIVPVVTDGGKVVGVVTDRDICMATAMKNRSPSNIALEDVLSGEVYSCTPDDDVIVALQTMRDRKVRRLPVLDDGCLTGMLSMNDIVRSAQDSKFGKGYAIDYRDVALAYKSICEPRVPKQQTVKAGA